MRHGRNLSLKGNLATLTRTRKISCALEQPPPLMGLEEIEKAERKLSFAFLRIVTRGGGEKKLHFHRSTKWRNPFSLSPTYYNTSAPSTKKSLPPPCQTEIKIAVAAQEDF
jgi:hypothetical protein